MTGVSIWPQIKPQSAAIVTDPNVRLGVVCFYDSVADCKSDTWNESPHVTGRIVRIDKTEMRSLDPPMQR